MRKEGEEIMILEEPLKKGLGNGYKLCGHRANSLVVAEPEHWTGQLGSQWHKQYDNSWTTFQSSLGD
jgi:hypothetical protein